MKTPHVASERLLWLDAVRGIAALLVLAQHLRNAVLVDFAQIDRPQPWQRALYFVTNLGHESVMVFFVLSGFFVGGSVLRAGARFDWRDYLLARGLRLWCVLVPCLALTWVCDQWLLASAPSLLDGGFADAWHSPPRAGAYDASWSTLLGNLFFVQTVAVPVFGSNGPLWSLANEAWYYLLFPLLAIAVGRVAGLAYAQRVLALLPIGVIVVAMPIAMLTLFAVWLMGVAVWVAARRFALSARARSLANPPALGLVLALLLAALAVSRAHLVPAAWQVLPDLAIGVVFALLCWQLTQRPATWPRRPVAARAVVQLSDISFSLYLCHFPLVLVIGAACFRGGRMQPDAIGLAVWATWFAALVTAAAVMWWAFERHTPALRALIAGPRRAAPFRSVVR